MNGFIHSKISRCLLTLLLFAVLVSSPQVTYAKDSSENVIYMNHVTPNMFTASFWGASDIVKMAPDAITAMNEANFNTESTCMNRLINCPNLYHAASMKANLAAFDFPKGLYLNGAPVQNSVYETIKKNIANAAAATEEAVQYGVVVNRSVLKSLPYAIPLSDSQDDPDWDQLALYGILVGEPVLAYSKTADGQFTYVKSEVCDGWMPSEDLAICHTKEEWLSYFMKDSFLLVTGDKVVLEDSLANPKSAGLVLEMGTKLKLSSHTGFIGNRMSWYNHVVLLPTRGSDGYLEEVPSLIPINKDVHVGFLPFTEENLLNQAMKCLGNRYGWGGSLHAQDCSAYIRNLYGCFGFNLPRNTTWQAQMPVQKTDVSTFSTEEKMKFFDSVPIGAIVQFPGHEMLYLGKFEDDYYTINDVSSLLVTMPSDGTNARFRGRGVIVNGLLDTKRANGKSWFEEVNKVIIPFAK